MLKPARVGLVSQHVEAHAARLGARAAGALAQHTLALLDALLLHLELRDDHEARRRHAAAARGSKIANAAPGARARVGY